MKRAPKKAIAAAVMFAATLNLNGCVYGPPPEDDPFFSAEVNKGQTSETDETAETSETDETAETAEEYDPSLNIEATVYGPPEWFE